MWAVDPPGFGYLLDMVTSTDGGTLWSSEATLAVSPTALYTLELATTPAGRGVAVNGGDTEARPIWVYVIDRAGRTSPARASATPPCSCAPTWATASASSACACACRPRAAATS